MNERFVYFLKDEFKTVIHSCGGVWNDTKQRPIVCLLKASENENLFWAIPMGNMAHRNEEQRKRIESFMNLPSRDIRSCYYHIGRTDKESLFFISDAVPVTDQYVDKEYLVNNCPFEIKNEETLNALRKKLYRILSDENRKPNKYRQHITDVKRYLINCLNAAASDENEDENKR